MTGLSMEIFLQYWLGLVLTISGCLALEEACPPQEEINPCHCTGGAKYVVVSCHNIQDLQTFSTAIQGLRNHLVDELWIEDSELGEVPGDMFKGTHILSITFLNTKLKSLGTSDHLPFTGLEHILERLAVHDAFTDKENPVSTPLKFQHLEHLEHLDLEGNIIPKIGNDWFGSGYKNLKSLYINDCGLEDLGNKVFANLNQLTVLDLSENKIHTLSRSMLPPQAQHLAVIWLRRNKIQNFPADAFTNLPSLERLYLPGNEIKTLPEETWKKIMGQLTLLFLNGNPLVCDSHLKWFLTAQTPEYFEARCKEPTSLAGKHLSDLTEDDLGPL